jgi:hypothetical protein
MSWLEAEVGCRSRSNRIVVVIVMIAQYEIGSGRLFVAAMLDSVLGQIRSKDGNVATE